MIRNNIYYLLDFYKKCTQIVKYGDSVIKKFCHYINIQLNKYFSMEQQVQLKFHNFNCDTLNKFVFEDIDDISFVNINQDTLGNFFDEVSFVDIKQFY